MRSCLLIEVRSPLPEIHRDLIAKVNKKPDIVVYFLKNNAKMVQKYTCLQLGPPRCCYFLTTLAASLCLIGIDGYR